MTNAVDYFETLFDNKDETETDDSSIAAQIAEYFGLSQGESLIKIAV